MKMGIENKFRRKTFYIACGAETNGLTLEVQEGCIRGVKNLNI